MRKDVRTADELKKDIEKIKIIMKEVHKRGIGDYKQWYITKEGEASRIYWKGVSRILPREIGFENPSDPFNIALNYLYSILASEVWFAIELAGLDPYLGYLHKDSSRRPSLVMDLMEEFRQPVVDKELIHFFSLDTKWRDIIDSEENKLTDKGRKKLLEIYYKTLDKRVTFLNRSLPIKAHIQLQPLRLAKYIMGYAKEYQPYNII